MVHHTILSSRVLRIARALGQIGLDAAALCRAAQIDMDALARPGARCPIDSARLLWQLALDASGNPALGLEAASVFNPAGLDVLDYTMMSCATLATALERAIRYARIVDEATEYSCQRLADGWQLAFSFHPGTLPAPRQSYEFVMLSSLNFCRWIVGQALRPQLVEFSHPAPPDPQPYQQAFQCPLRFDAGANAIHLSSADLALPLLTHNPQLAKLHERCADEDLASLARGSTVTRARALIAQHLPDGEPSRQLIAKALYMSERTLLRRLQAERTTFHQLLDDTRRELARDYLAASDISLTEAAYLLGFADQSNFCRAARRWFRLSPRDMRNQLRPGPVIDGSGFP